MQGNTGIVSSAAAELEADRTRLHAALGLDVDAHLGLLADAAITLRAENERLKQELFNTRLSVAFTSVVGTQRETTPRPWYVWDSSDSSEPEIIIHGGPNNEVIARMDLGGAREGDGLLIVQAVNTFGVAQAAVDDADTLGLLERLADCDDGWVELKWNTPKGWVGVRITTEPAKIQARYYYNGWRDCARDDAEALLTGEEKR